MASTPQNLDLPIVIIGAGPAGLSAAHVLVMGGRRVIVLEADPTTVGGLSRTVEYRGYRFDIGGHRFFSKSDRVERFWQQLLGDDLLTRPRLSRILFRGRRFAYPLRPLEAVRQLGTLEAFRCALSFVRARVAPIHPARTVEDWVSNQFGRRLYEMFFRTYTEKVWGMRCSEISADWAAQRIKGVSLGSAVWHAVIGSLPHGRTRAAPKSMIESFRYPRLGPGMMWEACRREVEHAGGVVALDRRVTGVLRIGRQHWRITATDTDGRAHHYDASHVVSSAPLGELIPSIVPAPTAQAVHAATALRYRDFITVAVIVRRGAPLPDTWLYVHDESVRVGRIQNYRAWSPALVADDTTLCLGLEYFCNEGDALWRLADAELQALAIRELEILDLITAGDALDSTVVRQHKAYPVYDDAYETHVRTIRDALEAYPELHVIGRNGMHKYNNQDHSMMTAFLTAENILSGTQRHDVWRVNQDAEYLETNSASGLRAVPVRAP